MFDVCFALCVSAGRGRGRGRCGGQEGDEEQVSSPATLLPRWDLQLNSLLTLQQHLDPSEVKGGHATPTATAQHRQEAAQPRPEASDAPVYM